MRDNDDSIWSFLPWSARIGIPLGIALGILLVYLITPLVSGYENLDNLPITPIQRAVEPTGGGGQAEYWVFDDSGQRYEVTQELFDSLMDVPIRK